MKRFKELILKEASYKGEGKVETKKYSWGTMKTVHHGSEFSIPLHPEHHQAIAKLKDNEEHKFKTEDGKHWTAKRMGDKVHFHGANDGGKTVVNHSQLKEEVELSEGIHRDLAAQGKMHPDMAKHMSAGKEMDFYAHKTGDKMSGKVVKNDGKEVHIKVTHNPYKEKDSSVHKFKISSKLDEAMQKSDIPAYLRKAAGDKLKLSDVKGPRKDSISHPDNLAKARGVKEELEESISYLTAILEGLENLSEEELMEVAKATGSLKDACWKGYTAVGMKEKNGKKVPNCVPVKESSDEDEEDEMEDEEEEEDDEEMKEQLKGNQHKLDVDKDGKIEGEDLAKLRKMKEEMNADQMAKREKIVKGMKKSFKDFKAKYGDRAKSVMYATATKMAMKEETIEEDVVEVDEAWPGTPEYKAKYGSPERKKGSVSATSQGHTVGTGSGVKHVRDYEKAEREPAAEKQEKRGRGRPKGSASGARQIGHQAADKEHGADYTGYKLHLPNK